MWTYEQSTGVLKKDGVYIDTGYSGHGIGLNNPDDQALANIGPIPEGTYTIGAPRVPVDHLGPFAMPLAPDPSTNEYGRFGFHIHGDTASQNHSASDGCIILSHSTRVQIAESIDRQLTVIA